MNFTPIPEADITRSIRMCYSDCDRHGCKNLATFWSEPYPAQFTGAPQRTRVCSLHLPNAVKVG